MAIRSVETTKETPMATSGTTTSPGAVDQQQDQHHQDDGGLLGVIDALAGGQQHLGADGRRAGHAQLQPLGKTGLLPHGVEVFEDLLHQRDVLDDDEFRVELEPDQRGLAVLLRGLISFRPTTSVS